MPKNGDGESDDSQLTICIVQPPLRQDEQHPLDAVDTVLSLLKQAALEIETYQHARNSREGPVLFLLPELCPIGYSDDTFANYLPQTPGIQKMYLLMDTKMQEAAKSLNAHLCYGTIGWENSSRYGDLDSSTSKLSYFIRQVVINPLGECIAKYDKIHLCDYGDCSETRFFMAGTQPVTFAIGDFRFGILICADMRYPLLSHHYVKTYGVDVLLQPACFMRDISFRTWASFRETRAVENAVYFAAANYSGDDYGEASLVPPWVDQYHEPRVMGTEVGYLIGTIDRYVLEEARTKLPFFRHLSQDTVGCGGCRDPERDQSGKKNK